MFCTSTSCCNRKNKQHLSVVKNLELAKSEGSTSRSVSMERNAINSAKWMDIVPTYEGFESFMNHLTFSNTCMYIL